MALEWSSSINKKITLDKKQSLLCHMPDSIQKALVRAWQQHYEELYEPEAEATVSLQDVLDEILDSFQSNNEILIHLRYVWMALILASVVEPTVKYYQPNNTLPEDTIARLTQWLLETIAEVFDYGKQFSQAPKDKVDTIAINILSHLSTENKISSFQVLSEALDVYISAIKTLEPGHSLEALLDILDDCLEGYAIFPGSYGRRELFNWWLLDIVPSSWYLLPPSSIYSANKLTDENITGFRLNRLEEISSAMWYLILRASQNQETDSLNFCNTFNYINKEVDKKMYIINQPIDLKWKQECMIKLLGYYSVGRVWCNE